MLSTNFYEKGSSGSLSNAYADVFGAAAATPQSEYKAIFANYLHNTSYIMEDNQSPTPTPLTPCLAPTLPNGFHFIALYTEGCRTSCLSV
jgi:hypothetical protein